MPQPPSLTPEQRHAALEKAARARHERAEIKDHLKSGRVTLQELLVKAESDDIVGKMKVLAVLEALPGYRQGQSSPPHGARRHQRDPPAPGPRSQAARVAARGRSPALILVVCGPGGVGKGTIIRRLVAADERLWLSRSWTTRPAVPASRRTPTPSSTGTRFSRRVAEGGFLEWATILGEYYGTPMPEPPEGRDVVLEIDVQGARQVLERRPDAYCVLIRAPSPRRAGAAPPVEGRLGGAHRSAAWRSASWRRRRASSSPSHVVVNDDLDEAVRDLAGIVEEFRRQGCNVSLVRQAASMRRHPIDKEPHGRAAQHDDRSTDRGPA